MDWKTEMGQVIDAWAAQGTGLVVVDRDIDGITCAALLGREYDLKVIGLYNGTHLQLFDDHSREDAINSLWLDQDISHPQISCIGQHLVHHEADDRLPLRSGNSWNPNVWQRQAWSSSFTGRGSEERDKYPLGTAHLLAAYLNFRPTTPDQLAVLAHIDGTWSNAVRYEPNFREWQDLMFPDLDFIEQLGPRYAEDPSNVRVHQTMVERLCRAGIVNRQGSGKHVAELSEDLQEMTGRQSLKGSLGTNPERFLEYFRDCLNLIQGVFGSTAETGETTGFALTGTRSRYFPEQIENSYGSFDQMMEQEKIFSHAFTNRLNLSYTTGIDL